LGIGIFTLVCWFEVRKTRVFLSPRVIFGLLLVGLLTFIEGKRNSIFLLFFNTVLITYYETQVRLSVRKSLYFMLFTILVIFIVVYPYFGKGDVVVTRESSQNIFFRDNITLPCIANAHLTDNEIMSRGNGALFVVSMYAPRKFWPDKPYSTPHYVTRYLLGKDMNPEDELVGWGYGVGFIEDGLVNFGYLGVVLYTALIVFFCRCIDYSIIRHGTVMCLLQGMLAYSCYFSLHIIVRFFLVGGVPLLLFMIFLDKTNSMRSFPMERHSGGYGS